MSAVFVVLQERMKLQRCEQQWTDYNSSITRCREWLKSAEKTVRDLDLKSSLAEKQQQLRTVQVFLELPFKIKN